MRINNVVIVVTSHIAQQSISDVERAVKKYSPAIIAVELDKQRYFSLTHPEAVKKGSPPISKIGLSGYLLSVIGAWAQQKLGNIVKTEPGADMKAAIEIAHKNAISLALIDRDIEYTLKRFSERLSARDKWQIFYDLTLGMVFHKKGSALEFDLRKVPEKEMVKRLMEEIKKRYPSIYESLIHERDMHMADRLYRLSHLRRLARTVRDTNIFKHKKARVVSVCRHSTHFTILEIR